MAWVKGTDTFNTHPAWMRAAALAVQRDDDRLVSELKGVAYALYTQSAIAYTDYFVGPGDLAVHAGLSRARAVLTDLMNIGILTDVSEKNEPRYKLLEDPEFIDLIKSNERLMRKKRDRDRNKGSLVVPVLLRDGDFCRYCGIEVRWESKNTGDRGTFDHREPNEETTPKNFVVCCWDCNQARSGLKTPDDELPLLPPPVDPTYGKWIRERLRRWHRMTEQVSKDLKIPNPLHSGSVESPVPASSRTTVTIPSTNPSQVPADLQLAGEPQFLADSQKVESASRVANEISVHPASMGTSASIPPRPHSPEPPSPQPGRDPRKDSHQDAPGAFAAKGNTQPPRKRRRRKNRSRK